MAVFKCKMCGGDLEILKDENVCECEFCGSRQTIPSQDNEKKVTLFNRANKLRLSSNFDKAAEVYEQIVAEFPQEAEAYWGLCLSNYGIEYVDDPATAAKIPTVHRASFTKLRSDTNYELALEYAPLDAKAVYQEEAKEIDRIMSKIISISQEEEPYDIFICYKETSESGERTEDSVLAQDIYKELTQNGYKVFFSRITLEDKLGMEYEPYIFAALNSAKVMLAVGTDFDHYNSVWVKNEWSRFIKLMSQDTGKVLIPCFKGLDAYDMPDEFARFQAQDMAKIGAMQDLSRGIDKLFGKTNGEEKNSEPTQQASGGPTASSLLERAFMFLEEGNIESASEYLEKVLDIEPKNAMAYIGKLLVNLKLKHEEDLAKQEKPFDDNEYYLKALKFADEKTKARLQGYNKQIKLQIKQKKDKKASEFSELEELARPLINAVEKEATKNKIAKLSEDKSQLEENKKALQESERIIKEYDEEIEAIRIKAEEKRQEGYSESAKIDTFSFLQSRKKAEAREKSKEAFSEYAKLEDQRQKLREECNQRIPPFSPLVDDVEFYSKIYGKGRIKSYGTINVINKIDEIINMIDTMITDIKSENFIENDTAETNLEELSNKLLSSKALKEYINDNKYDRRSRFDLAYKLELPVIFGKAPYNEPIEWLVLDRVGDEALLLSYKLLDYTSSFDDEDWKWDEVFIGGASFKNEEKKLIIKDVGLKSKYTRHDEVDYIYGKHQYFILSVEEAEKYFSSDKERICQYTDGKKMSWWLRSKVYPKSSRNAFVEKNGAINKNGEDRYSTRGIRPAMWIKL